jgi:hypothetical protein
MGLGKPIFTLSLFELQKILKASSPFYFITAAACFTNPPPVHLYSYLHLSLVRHVHQDCPAAPIPPRVNRTANSHHLQDHARHHSRCGRRFRDLQLVRMLSRGCFLGSLHPRWPLLGLRLAGPRRIHAHICHTGCHYRHVGRNRVFDSFPAILPAGHAKSNPTQSFGPICSRSCVR